MPPQLSPGRSLLWQSRLKLGIAGKPPALEITLTIDDQTPSRRTVATRAKAHAQARAAAIEHGLALYEVTDPASLAQAMRFSSPTENTQLPPHMQSFLDEMNAKISKP